MRGSAAFTIFPNNGSLSVRSTPLNRAAAELAPEVAPELGADAFPGFTWFNTLNASART